MGRGDDIQKFSWIALCALAACATGADSATDPFDAGADAPVDGSPDAAGSRDASGTKFDAGVGDDSGVMVLAPDAATDAAPVESGSNDSAPPPIDASDAGPLMALIGKWNFDEGTGTSSADLSGLGHAATFMGGASWAAAGKEGSGLALDGATGYADVGVSLIDTAQSFSVLCWAKLVVVNSWEIAVSQDDVTGSLFGLKLRGDATNDFDFDVETSDTTNPGFVVAQSTSMAQALTWVHLAGVYDATGGGTLTVYVDGVPQATAAVGMSVLASSGHFVIGRGLYNGVTGSFLNGTLDEVEVHAAALTSAQVAAVYASEE